jgi:hypothetical protein
MSLKIYFIACRAFSVKFRFILVLFMFKSLSDLSIMIMRYENIRLQIDFPRDSSRNKSKNRRGKFFDEDCYDLFYKFVTT